MTSPRKPSRPTGVEPAEFAPDWAVPPGQLILAELKAKGMTQAEFALRTSLTPKHVNQLVKGITTLSPTVAVALERTLNIPADFWLKIEAVWRANQAKRDSQVSLGQYASWFARFPVDILASRDVIKRYDPIEVKVDRLLRFFEVTDTTAFEKVWLKPQASFKRSQLFDIDPYATALWIRLAEVAAEERVPAAAEYDPRRLRAVLSAIPPITRRVMPDAFIAMRELLASVGVLLVFMPEVPGTRICGVSRWLSTGHPVIALTNRNKRIDSFWFYLGHEIAHILLHPGRATYIDEYEKSVDDDSDDQETTANDFAKQLFIPLVKQHRLAEMSVGDLENFARELDVAVDIVAGQYARLHNKWGAVSKLRPTVRLDSVLSDV